MLNSIFQFSRNDNHFQKLSNESTKDVAWIKRLWVGEIAVMVGNTQYHFLQYLAG
jgi:hypothetical protein